MTFDAVEYIFSINPWLNLLGPDVYNLIVDLTIQDATADQVVAEIRNTDAYKERFSGLVERQAKGLPAMSEAAYLDTEASYQRQLQNAQVFDIMFQSEESFLDFAADQIGSDVSAAEFSRRLDRGFAAVADNRPEIEDIFSTFYGVAPTSNAMLAYFLDPDVGMREIENQVAAAVVGGEALAYGLNISRTRAELLASSGVSQEMARAGFADIAREQPVLQRLAQLHQFTPLSQQDLEEFFFHEDSGVQAERQRIFDTALSQFRSTSVRPASATSGLTELVDRRETV